jgi:RHS repeat-associated protein
VPFNGRILAEYFGGSPGGTIFDHPDELGSLTTGSDYGGNPLNERLYYPFGEFWTGASTPNLGMHQTFAQLPDYDAETDQYNTLNRHYTPMGRWMSPDPGGAGANPSDPQTWNMYAYVRNNPTTLTDPTGLLIDFNCSNASSEVCFQATTYVNNQLNGAFTVGRNSDSSLYVVNQSSVDVSKLSDADKALFNAITDKTQTATVNIVGNTGQSDFGDNISKGVNTVDMGNLAHLGDPSNAGGLTPGGALAHEMMDAWYSLSESADKADQDAGKLFPGLLGITNEHNVGGIVITGSTYDQPISNGKGVERSTIEYINKPRAIDIFGKTLQQKQQILHDAGSRVTGVSFVIP